MAVKLPLIGVGAATFDADRDACFGKLHDPRSETCQQCILPVVINQRVKLLNEVCGRYQQQGRLDPADITRLSAAEVEARLAAGRTPSEIVSEMIGEGDPSALFDAAWRVYSHRRFALRKAGRVVPGDDKRVVRSSVLGDE